MIITRKHLPRRTFLRGLGGMVALPFLDAMVPAVAAPSDKKYPVRLAFPYVPNGMMMQHWTPSGAGKNFEITRLLKPLEPFRQDMLVLTGLHHANGVGPSGDHARASATYLTGVPPSEGSLANVRLGISVDQVAAQAIGSETRLPSIELGCESTREVGACDGGFSCAYMNNMSWRNATTPLPLETNPRLVFERLYGSLDTSTDPKLQARLDANRKSVLDYVSAETKRLEGTLGVQDKLKLEEYLGAVRDVEKQIERAESDSRLNPEIEKPTSAPTVFAEHARLMSDLLVLAFQADITRVATLVYAKEGSARAYPELGFGDGHHPLTHHRKRPEIIEKCAVIEHHHMEQFAYLVGKMKAIQEGDGTLLDHSMVVYGSAMSEPNIHNHTNVPCVLLGRGDGNIKPGRHVVYPTDTPQTNLWLTLLDRMGVRTETLGDSTGRVQHLTDI